MEKIAAMLEGIGLTRGEIKVYFALLELGSSTTGGIVRQARVSRSKVYEMLDRLLEKGLVSFVVKENVKYFEAAAPEAIFQYVKRIEKELKEKANALQGALPLFQEKRKVAKVPQSATVYEGIKGIKAMFNEILSSLKTGDEYFAISVEPEVYRDRDFALFIRNYHLRRAEKGIRVKLLVPKSLKQAVADVSKTRFMQVRYLFHAVPAATLIYEDNVATFVWSETPTAIVMRSPTIAARYRRFFNELWKKALL